MFQVWNVLRETSIKGFSIMTFFVKCNNCGKVEEAVDLGHYPGNPPGWYSRVENKKHKHACCRACITDDQLVFPL